jgi:hypothetical protein
VEYVFTGRVVGIVGPFESKKFGGQAWGLRVEVGESVHLPVTPADYFEVIPFKLYADCSSGCGFNYSRIAETHVKNPKLVRALSEKRKEWINQSKQE